MTDANFTKLADKIQALGIRVRAAAGIEDVRIFKRLKALSFISQCLGRVLIMLGALKIGSGLGGLEFWFLGTALLAFHLSLEAQLNHSVMHGAYSGLPGAENFTPENYETIAIPFQSKTWGDAHRIHHSHPSILEDDPDTVHPLFRIHEETPWRPWHLFNTFLGTLFVFECWAFDYDRFLKKVGVRKKNDWGEIRKFSKYIYYQFVLFPFIGGTQWKIILCANILAVIIRNFVFVGLQTGSSVGHEVSTRHAKYNEKKSKGTWYQFQIESSKNFVIHGFWKIICGGLDRHIEHHLFPRSPPTRLHEISGEVKKLCEECGVQYQEHPSFFLTFKDSISYLWKLSRPR